MNRPATNSTNFYDTNVITTLSGTLGNVLDNGSIGAKKSGTGYYSPGVDVANIRNMADVRTPNFTERAGFYNTFAGQVPTPSAHGQGTAPLANAGIAYPPPSDNRRSQRMFFAQLVGYGRTNRKQLDFAYWRHLRRQTPPGTTGEPVTARGVVYCDHPAGFKYGYMNCDHLNPSAVFRGDRYGQLRDMLEQRQFGKTYSFGDEFNKRGESESAVTCIFVDADGSPIDDALKTQCLNLSTAMTSSKPFIEGEVLRELIFSSESVTVE